MQTKNLCFKTDFKIREKCEAGYVLPFRFLYFVGTVYKAYEVSFDGKEYHNCVLNADGTLTVCFDDHGLCAGKLQVERRYYLDDEQFRTGVCDMVVPAENVIVIDEDAPTESKLFQVVLSTKGLSYLECYSVVEPYWMYGGYGEAAYANEEARKAAEAERKANWAAWFGDTKSAWAAWFDNAKKETSNWFSGTKTEVATWFESTKNEVASWFNATRSNVESWFNTTKDEVSSWFYSTQSAWNAWFSDTKSAYSSWFSSTKSDWASWFSSTKSGWESWFSSTKNQWATWLSARGDQWNSWFASVQSAWTSWFGDTKSSVASWFSGAQSAWDAWFIATKDEWKVWIDQRADEWNAWWDERKADWTKLSDDASAATAAADVAAKGANTAATAAIAATELASRVATSIMIRPTGMSVDVPKVVPVGATAMVEVSMVPDSCYASKVFQSKRGCFVAPDGSAEFTEIGTAVFYVVPTLNDTIAKKVEVTVRALESLQAEDGTEITMEDGSTFEI